MLTKEIRSTPLFSTIVYGPIAYLFPCTHFHFSELFYCSHHANPQLGWKRFHWFAKCNQFFSFKCFLKLPIGSVASSVVLNSDNKNGCKVRQKLAKNQPLHSLAMRNMKDKRSRKCFFFFLFFFCVCVCVCKKLTSPWIIGWPQVNPNKPLVSKWVNSGGGIGMESVGSD